VLLLKIRFLKVFVTKTDSYSYLNVVSRDMIVENMAVINVMGGTT
jgi:hypothetical protein